MACTVVAAFNLEIILVRHESDFVLNTIKVKTHTRIKIDMPGAIAWSPQGDKIAVYSRLGTKVAIFDIDGSQFQELNIDSIGAKPYAGNSIAFLSDTSLLVTRPAQGLPSDKNNALSIWDITKPRPVKNIVKPMPDKDWRYNSAYNFAVSADGSTIAATSVYLDQPVTVYSTRDWTAILTIPVGGDGKKSDCVQSIALSSNGHSVAIGTLTGKILIFDAKNGEQITTINTNNGPLGGVVSLAFSPDDQLIAGGISSPQGIPVANALRIWNTKDGTLLTALPQDIAPPIYQVSWSMNGKYIVFYSGDKTVKYWSQSKRQNGSEVVPIGEIIDAISISNDGKHLAVASGGSDVTIFDILH